MDYSNIRNYRMRQRFNEEQSSERNHQPGALNGKTIAVCTQKVTLLAKRYSKTILEFVQLQKHSIEVRNFICVLTLPSADRWQCGLYSLIVMENCCYRLDRISLFDFEKGLRGRHFWYFSRGIFRFYFKKRDAFFASKRLLYLWMDFMRTA